MNNYWYLYVLMDADKPFYVGSSNWPKMRYQYHCSIGYSKAFVYIRNMREHAKYPDMRIINHFESRRESKWGEQLLNSYFAAMGNNLCNTDYNPPYNVLKPELMGGIAPRNKMGYADFVDQRVAEYLKLNEHLKYNGTGYYTNKI